MYYNGNTKDVDRLHIVLQALFAYNEEESRFRLAIKGDLSCCAYKTEQWRALAACLLGKALQIPQDGVLRVDPQVVLESVNEAVAADCAQQPDEWPLLRKLIESRSLYMFIAKCLSTAGCLNSRGVELAVGLAVLPLGSGPLQQPAMSYFVQWILTIPGLLNRIGVAGVTAISKMHINWIILAEHVRDEMARQQASHAPSEFGIFGSQVVDHIRVPLAAISIIGNMTAFVIPQLSRQGTLALLDAAFISACTACARVIPSCNLFDPASKKASDILSQRLQSAIDTNALKWLNGVLSVRVLDLLVRASCMDTSVKSNVCARDAQDLLLILIQKWGKMASSTTIDNLFQAVDIRTVGWRDILHDPQFRANFAGDRVRVDTIKSYNLSPLYLLCEVLNRQLETIGDDELFRQGMSLPLEDVRTIARVCRNIAFALFWSQETADGLAHIRDSAAMLARQLFIRNARHPFVADDFWLVPPSLLDMASFADKVAEDPMFSTESKGIEDSDSSSSEDESDSDSSSDSLQSDAIRPPNSRLSWAVHRYSSSMRQHLYRTNQTIMTPRIAVLRGIPFVVPFNDRVRLFHALINRDRARLGLSAIGHGSESFPSFYGFAQAVVRRGQIFEDGFRQLYPLLTGKPLVANEENDRRIHTGALEEPVHELGNEASAGMAPWQRHGMAPESLEFPFNRPNHDPLMSSFADIVDDVDALDSEQFAFQNAMAGNSRSSSHLSRQDIFKYRMKITFVDQHGMQEAGIDGGGVFKEFLTSLVREAFDPQLGLFATTAQHNPYPNPESMQTDAKHRQLVLDKYRFLGAVIGKALYEGVLVDAPLALFFLGYCVGQLPEFNDLPTLDEDLYQGLVALKNYPASGEVDENGEDEIYRVFALDFTTSVSLRNGQVKTVPLVPHGEQIKVTAQNRLQYLDLIAHLKLVKQIDAQVKAFVSGLHAVIPENWLRLLFASPLELSRLLCGDAGALDVGDWQRNTVYEGAFKALGSHHPLVRDFWSVVEHGLSEKQRQCLCRFATSCERPPLLGFAELCPRFCIAGVDADDDTIDLDSRLPSASTCVNLLKLPVYSSKQVLHSKLVTAIESNAGFDLS
ncbi:ubiquitin-protein ligase (E3) [Coemansia brasiliensis]|uniref:HECT-type E3 ubiquitin transferase n=1 Tax=Coemansia brasiliensis TaxID=2650707 RepID=A0A9W8IDD1_9FUNG|nr:ubiquitin-protein ligase (E3) [Coemansia brasiliensis]